MPEVNHSILQDLSDRSLVSQTTAQEELENHLNSAPRTVYCGFDPTANSLHIGSLIPLLTLKRFQMHGHKPIALIGGATGLIGDPSFKATERKLNTPDIIEQWSDSLKSQVSHFLDFDDKKNGAQVVNNFEWMQDQHVLTFLRDTGKYFSVNQMIAKESVKQRLQRDDTGISFTEFSYMILQGYDFSELYRRYNCTVQIGGSDQWGNITCGTELTRRKNKGQVYGITQPLVTKADGSKFGKTESGTIWLDAAKTSPYAFYQFWINTADADVYRFLRYFTFLPVHTIAEIENDSKNSVHGPRQAQQLLAEEVTGLIHGKTGVQSAQHITQALFSGAIRDLSNTDLMQLRLDGLPASVIHRNELTQTSMTQLLTESGLATSGKQVKDALNNKALLVNGEPKSMEDNMQLPQCFTEEKSLHSRFFIVKLGKKKHHLFELI
ncbi:MAG: tyrosine--tRNA ligase [Endozoicomonadaceae bacterium]|nr:tyrosine--tRNA ligase [Endozoicomonadaceae bacterium]MCY4329128.1 tyrosine--tRNA ligase [Endozoicomonadaceae bacterium]